MYDAPKGPSLRPKNPAHKEPINGKKTSKRYIKNLVVINYMILSNVSDFTTITVFNVNLLHH